MESRKMVLANLPAWLEWRRRCSEESCGHSGGGKNGTNGESSIDIYTLSCVKYAASDKLLCKTGSPAIRQSVMT